VLAPQKIEAFLHTLPLGKIPGVGKVTLQKMNALSMHTAGDLRGFERGALLNHFGRYGYRLYDLARGIDERPVKPSRERLQISTEITLPEDLPLAQIARHLPHLAEDLWRQTVRKNVQARTVTLKLKTTDFPHHHPLAHLFFGAARCRRAGAGCRRVDEKSAALRR
jgi:DNA polymerase-4